MKPGKVICGFLFDFGHAGKRHNGGAILVRPEHRINEGACGNFFVLQHSPLRFACVNENSQRQRAIRFTYKKTYRLSNVILKNSNILRAKGGYEMTILIDRCKKSVDQIGFHTHYFRLRLGWLAWRCRTFARRRSSCANDSGSLYLRLGSQRLSRRRRRHNERNERNERNGKNQR